MVFGEIFISLLVILILYYAVAISMELFMKPQVQDAASGNEETEIDIADEARNFQTIEVRRDTRPGKKNPPGENTADNKAIRPVMTNASPSKFSYRRCRTYPAPMMSSLKVSARLSPNARKPPDMQHTALFFPHSYILLSPSLPLSNDTAFTALHFL